MILLLFLPFIIELFGDYYLIKKGKKDIHWIVRVLMIQVVLYIVYPVPYESFKTHEVLKYFIIAVLPYLFFDPSLNLLRGKKLTYSGKTKEYDLFLGMFNPYLILVGRVVCFIVLLVIYFNL